MFGKRKPSGEKMPERRRDVSGAGNEPRLGEAEKQERAGGGTAPRSAAPAKPGSKPAPRPAPPIANPSVNNPIAGITAPSRGAGNGAAAHAQKSNGSGPGGSEKPAASESGETAAEPQRSEEKGREVKTMSSESEGKKLTVGRDIRLAGEITTCDTLVVEGQVECNLTDSKMLDIASSGVFKGKASVEVAEISGLFEGDLTVTQHLRLHGTGQIKGTLRYREMEIERGGRISGDISELDGAKAQAAESRPQPAEPAQQPTITPDRDEEPQTRAAAGGNAS